MPDRVFDEPRLAGIYDDLDPDRSDLDVYVALARELGARTVVDVGCGTGSFACLLASEGFEVVGVDPAAAMLDVARAKPAAGRVRWIYGLASDLPPLDADLATMTGNVAQVFVDEDDWVETLAAVYRVLRPGGRIVFETRRPERQGWLEWNREDSYTTTSIPKVGKVRSWYEVLDVSLPFVTFRGTIVFEATGETLTSESTLRFRTQTEIEASLAAAGFAVEDIREAPDRPGKELVFIALRWPNRPRLPESVARARVLANAAERALAIVAHRRRHRHAHRSVASGSNLPLWSLPPERKSLGSARRGTPAARSCGPSFTALP